MPEQNVRSATIQKSGHDGPSWTPTERRKRDQLMRQFIKGDTYRYVSREFSEGYDLIDWSDNGSTNSTGEP